MKIWEYIEKAVRENPEIQKTECVALQIVGTGADKRCTGACAIGFAIIGLQGLDQVIENYGIYRQGVYDTYEREFGAIVPDHDLWTWNDSVGLDHAIKELKRIEGAEPSV